MQATYPNQKRPFPASDEMPVRLEIQSDPDGIVDTKGLVTMGATPVAVLDTPVDTRLTVDVVAARYKSVLEVFFAYAAVGDSLLSQVNESVRPRLYRVYSREASLLIR
jgi:hypothetical protein